MQILDIMNCRFNIIATNQEAILNNLSSKSVRIVICIDRCMNQKKRLPQKATT